MKHYNQFFDCIRYPFLTVVDFVFADIEFINNLNTSTVKIGDTHSINVRRKYLNVALRLNLNIHIK